MKKNIIPSPQWWLPTRIVNKTKLHFSSVIAPSKCGLFLSSFVAILLLTALSLAHANPIELKYKFTKGEVDKYRLTLDMNMSIPGMPADTAPMDSKVSLVMLQKTLDVLPDGSAKIQLSYTDHSMSIAGMSKEQTGKLPSQTVTLTMSKEGKVLGMEGFEVPAGSSTGSGLDFGQMLSQVGFTGIFPAKPVEIGDSWAQALPVPLGGGNIKINSTLLSNSENIDKQNASKIKQDYSGYIDLNQLMKAVESSAPQNMKGDMGQAMSSISGDVKVNGTTVFYFSPTLGKLLKASGNIVSNIKINMPEEAIKSGAPSQIDMVMNLKLNVVKFK